MSVHNSIIKRTTSGVLISFTAIMAMFILHGQATHAQDNQESVTTFSAQVELNESGYATVSETIQYNFGGNERHGIFRVIPTRSYVEEKQGYEVAVDVDSVSIDGATVDYSQSTVGDNNVELRIGNADSYVSGEHTYEVNYTIGPVAIQSTDNFEIVRLNFPGDQWQVPVLSTSVTLKSTTSTVGQTCYSGPTGSRDQNCTVTTSGNTVTYTSNEKVDTGSTLTLEAVYPLQTFTQTAQLSELTPVGEMPAWVAVGIFGGIAALFSLVGIKPLIGYIRYRQRRKQELVIPQYEPPADMEPAEIGLLVDNSSSGAELTATLVQLAVKGYLKIVETREKTMFKRAEYNFVKLKDIDPKLPLFESQIHQALFLKDATVSSKSLPTTKTFREANIVFHKALKTNLISKGFYKKASILSWNLSERMTNEGYTRWAYIEGFRDFLKLTEANRMAMLEAPERKPEQFSEYLPYAIALGVEKQWAGQFKNLDVRTDSWYESSTSTRALNIAYLTSSLSQGLNGVSSSVNQSSGTSGSGGGFSGGGFSGGGGGSW